MNISCVNEQYYFTSICFNSQISIEIFMCCIFVILFGIRNYFDKYSNRNLKWFDMILLSILSHIIVAYTYKHFKDFTFVYYFNEEFIFMWTIIFGCMFILAQYVLRISNLYMENYITKNTIKTEPALPLTTSLEPASLSTTSLEPVKKYPKWCNICFEFFFIISVSILYTHEVLNLIINHDIYYKTLYFKYFISINIISLPIIFTCICLNDNIF